MTPVETYRKSEPRQVSECQNEILPHVHSDTLDKETTDFIEKNQKYCENNFLLQLIHILITENNWSNSESNFGGLSCNADKTARCLYSKIHQKPEQYYHLYNYLYLRYPTNEKLKKYTALLQNWELEIHDKYTDQQTKHLELLKCWRLHLGSTHLLKRVIESTLPAGKWDFLKQKWKLFQDAVRCKRQKILSKNELMKKCFEKVYNVIIRIFYGLMPLLYSFLLYFETLKNLSFAYLIYMSLKDLEATNHQKRDLGFETALLGFLLSSIILTQLIFIVISYHYLLKQMTQTIPWPNILKTFGLCSSLLGPLIPSFAFANYIHYSQKEYLLRRDLQVPRQTPFNTDQKQYKFTSPNQNDSINNHCAVEEHCDEKSDNEYLKNTRVDLYRKILNLQMHKKSSAQLYANFRVVSASIESYITIVILIIIFTCDNGENGTMSNAISQRLKHFLDFKSEPGEDSHSFLKYFYTSRVWIFVVFSSYSFLMMATSLVKYVNVYKDEQMYWGGQVFLFLYFTSHLITRITLAAAIYVTPHLVSNSANDLLISRIPASIFGVMFFVVHFFVIYWYKHQKIESFRKAPKLERLIHVLVNTLVVVPFRTSWSNIISDKCCELKSNEISRHQKGGHMERAISESENCVREIQNDNTCRVRLTEQNKEIEKLWWKNTKKELTFGDVKSSLPDQTECNTVQTVLDYLCENGYINKVFYFQPRQTKQEYFWLFIFHLLVNGMSLIIERCNGGIMTDKGRYISWDIRLGSFLVGLVFLWIYYSRYHLDKYLSSAETVKQRLKMFFIFICKEKVKPMTSIPNSLYEEYMDHSCSIRDFQHQHSQTSITVHVKIKGIEDISYQYEDEKGDSIVVVKGRFKKINTNSNRKILANIKNK